jgi:5-methylcytosine-specific restriction enzyme B
VVKLFDELNRRLARDLGPDKQIGHSFFMVPGLTEAQLHTVWAHHVLPTLAEYFAPRPVPVGYDLPKLFGGPKKKAEAV